MKILFLSYWGINDPLTVSTVYPHLRILSEMPDIDHILLVTIERSDAFSDTAVREMKKVKHHALRSSNIKPSVLNKILDFTSFPSQLIRIAREEEIGLIIARTSLAGALALKVHRRTNIPFFVESFEPHADYMIAAGVWNKTGLKATQQLKWEEQIRVHAAALMPVSEYYREELIREHVPAGKIFTMPCAVPLGEFRFNPEDRSRLRTQLHLKEDDVVGIYAGKFGGLYFDDIAFTYFKMCFDHFGSKFHLILLTSIHKDVIAEKCRKASLPAENIHVNFVPHREVPAWLSASDFAFCLHKPGKQSIAYSPIKNGEYWANGLPILAPKGIGDDSSIIEEENAGATFGTDPASFPDGLRKIAIIMKESGHRQRIHSIAEKHRDFKTTESVYHTLFSTFRT